MSSNFKKLFDEKNPIWIRIFKILVIVTAAILLVGGLVLSIVLATTTYKHESYVDFNFLTFVLGLVGACVAAFSKLVCGMLIVNYLNNVQAIRQKLDEPEA